MAVIELSNIIEGVVGPLPFAGVPSTGTSEVQTVTFGGTWLAAETFKLTFEGHTTAAITWSATNATLVANIDAALEALPNVGTGGVTTAVGTMTDGIGTITLTAGGDLAKKAIGTMTVAVNNSAEGTLAIAETTPGVDSTYRGLKKGGLISDITNGVLYINTGTPFSPTFTKVGTQT